jgi:hypothetical protein
MESRTAFFTPDNNEMTVRYHTSPDEDAMAAANRAKLIEALDALTSGDEASFWSIFDEGVVFYEASCLPYGGVHQGLEATKQAFAHMGQVFSSMKADLEGVLATRDIAILYQTINFRVRDNGNTGTLPVAELFRFRDGKVVEWRAHYFDSAMVARAISGNT